MRNLIEQIILEKYQLDELSKDTLKSYRSKAKKDLKRIDKAEKKIANKKLKEENLQELSKKTLGSYIKAAHRDSEKKTNDAKNLAAAGNAYKDIGDHKNAKKLFSASGEKIMKAANRHIGINKAVDRLTKEENLQELSKKTLGSYIVKASNSMASNRAKKYDKHFTRKEQDKAVDKEINRAHGIKTAVKKLTKEENIKIKKIEKSPILSTEVK